MATDRTRNFATIIYPESAPEDWIDILRDKHFPFLVSPLHDKDMTRAGEPKKPHYHVQFFFEGPKSQKQVEKIVEEIHGVGVEWLESPSGYARYLCHLDDYDKAQYRMEDVRAYGGIDYLEKIDRISDKFNGIAEIQDFCSYYNIHSFSLLCDYARKNNKAWYRALTTSCAVYFREYLKSKRWSDENNIRGIVDPISGEIIFELESIGKISDTSIDEKGRKDVENAGVQ